MLLQPRPGPCRTGRLAQSSPWAGGKQGLISLFQPAHKMQLLPFLQKDPRDGGPQSYTGCRAPRFFVHPSLKQGTHAQAVR